jgi:hypothetical protein
MAERPPIHNSKAKQSNEIKLARMDATTPSNMVPKDPMRMVTTIGEVPALPKPNTFASQTEQQTK